MAGPVAHIKNEYLIKRSSENDERLEKKEEEACLERDRDSTRSPLPKKRKDSKKKGMNKNRPKVAKIPDAKRLCQAYWPGVPPDGVTVCERLDCKFSHDVKTFLEEKPEDIGDTCYNYDITGNCRFGVTCRFGGSHINRETCTNIVSEENGQELQLKGQPKRTALFKEVQGQLWKKTYDFSKAIKAVGRTREVVEACNGNSEPSIGFADDSDLIRIRPEEKKKIDWKDKLYLAPLTTLGNLPFRRICKEFGADITCGEMAVALNLIQGQTSEWALTRKHESEDCFGVQLCGGNVEIMTKCAQLIQEQADVDFIDINMGCPIDLIFCKGMGSALMRRDGTVQHMVSAMNEVLRMPLTLKMRAGIQSKVNKAHTIIKKAKLWDVSMVAVHGRSKEQRYVRSADWSYIDTCAKEADPMPVFGSGDVLTYEEYARNRENKSVSGIMIARGALIKPWIFQEIKEQKEWDISSKERLEVLKKFTNYGLEHYGSDDRGVETTRRFLLEWLSFLHRYIPVGILEAPQAMNQRPEPFVGRDPLETLMASPNVKDWIKISEMLLGNVPDTFEFLPKHKANSWS